MTQSNHELQDQVALVTGSAKNIGRAINLALADAGAKVVINALTSGEEARALAEEIEAAGGEAMAHVADIRDEKAVMDMMKAVAERFGGLNILVNNASLRQLQPLEEWKAPCCARWRRCRCLENAATAR